MGVRKPILFLSVFAAIGISPVQAGPIQFADVQLFVHNDTGLNTQLGAGAPTYFSTLNGDNEGTFGWLFTNTELLPMNALRLLLFVDADLDRDTNTFFNEYGEFISLALPPGAILGGIAPSHWEIDEPGFFFGDIYANLLAGQLDGINGVPSSAPDDVSMALQFSIGTLLPGESARLVAQISSSDIGGVRHLDATSGAGYYLNGYSVIEGSGASADVPEPGTLFLTGGFLVLLVGLRRRQSCRASAGVVTVAALAALSAATAPAQQRPDLIISNLETSMLREDIANGVIQQAALTWIGVRVTNQGTAPAVGYTLSMWEDLDDDGVAGPGDAYFFYDGRMTFPDTLQPGQSRWHIVGAVYGGALSNPNTKKRLLLSISTATPESDSFNNTVDMRDTRLAQPKIAVDLELALALDVSGSIDDQEFLLQNKGYVDAFRSPGVIAAIEASKGVVVNVVHWGSEPVEVISPTLLRTAADSRAFADRIEATPRVVQGKTSLAAAVSGSATSIFLNGYEGVRKVIDVSGDGSENWGEVSLVRPPALRIVDTINGLPIGDDPELLASYKATIAGPRAFSIPVSTFTAFGPIVEAKIRREITGSSAEVLISDLKTRAKNNAVDLIWSPVAGAQSYNIYRRAIAGAFSLLKGGHVTTGASFADSALVNGTVYEYAVSWLSTAGKESTLGTIASARPMDPAARATVGPTITSSPSVNGIQGQPWSYRVLAVDPTPGDLLRYSLTAGPAGMTMDGATGAMSWTPGAEMQGYQAVSVRVQDRLGAYALQTFRLFVENIAIQNPPLILSTPPRFGIAGRPYRYQVQAVDPNPNTTLTFSAFDVFARWRIHPTTGVFEIPNPEAGVLPVSFTVTDGNGHNAVQTWSVWFSPALPPVITSKAVTTASARIPYTYTVTATDPNPGETLAFSLITFPSGMTIHPVTGVVSWTPTDQQAGSANVTVQVRDDGGLTAQQSFAITVTSFDSVAPLVSILTPAAGSILQSDFSITGTASDANLVRWTLEFQAPGETSWALLNSGTTSVTAATLGAFPATLVANNPYRLRLRAEDAVRASIAEVEVTVNSNEFKLGDLRQEFEDFRIPGLGMPIAIRRVYDSKQTRFAGDFGPGWALDFSSLNLQSDSKYNVSLTLPDGRRVRFAHAPVPIGLSAWQNAYTAQSGVYDTLENLDCPTLFGNGVNFSCQGFQTYNPTNFKLTTKSGFTYFVGSDGRVRRMEDRSGKWIEITPSKISSNFGVSLTIMRGTDGRIRKIFEPEAPGVPTNRIAYAYDAEGRLSAVHLQDQSENYGGSAISRYLYENSQYPFLLTRITNSDGLIYTRFVHDAAGRFTQSCKVYANGVEACGSIAPNVAGRQVTTLNARGFKTDLYLDDRGNVLTERRWLSTATYLDTVRTYDTRNNLLTELDPAGNQKSFTYDVRGNLLTETDPGGRVTAFTYGACDLKTSMRDPAGNITTFEYDAKCNLRFVRNPLNQSTEYRYDAIGQRTHLIDPTGSSWQWVHGATGQVSSVIDPFGKTSTFQHNILGDLLSRTDRNGRRTDFEYTPRHILLKETWVSAQPQKVRTFAIDGEGRVTQAVNDAGYLQLLYLNGSGLLGYVHSNPTGAGPREMFYGYHADETLASAWLRGSSKSQYEYDSAGRLASHTFNLEYYPSSKRVNYVYDAASQLTELRRFSDANGTTSAGSTKYEYDCGGCGGRLAAIRHRNAAGAPIHELTFDRDPNGDILTLRDREGTHTYTYDRARRLTTAIHPNTQVQPNETYTYDATGNRLTSHLSTSYQYSYQTVGNGNRLLQDQQFTYLYDDEGNMVRRTDKATGVYTEYAYDFHNLLTTVVQRSSTGTETGRAEYAYDAFDRRVKSVEAGQVYYYYYDGLNPILKTKADGSMVSLRMYGSGIDDVLADEAAGDTRWFLKDQVGTVRELRSNSGDLLNAYVYDSFGQLRLKTGASTVENDLLFTGREFGSGLGGGFFRMRRYDPSIGRFGGEDLMEEGGFAYSYAASNPLSLVDPLGLIDSQASLNVSMRVTPFARAIGRLTFAQKARLIATLKYGAFFISTFDGCLLANGAKYFGCLFYSVATTVSAQPDKEFGKKFLFMVLTITLWGEVLD